MLSVAILLNCLVNIGGSINSIAKLNSLLLLSKSSVHCTPRKGMFVLVPGKASTVNIINLSLSECLTLAAFSFPKLWLSFDVKKTP